MQFCSLGFARVESPSQKGWPRSASHLPEAGCAGLGSSQTGALPGNVSLCFFGEGGEEARWSQPASTCLGGG